MINDKHIQELRASGLNDDTIKLSGIYSATTEEAHKLLNRDIDNNDLQGLAIPYGQGYTRIKPDNPRKVTVAQKEAQDHAYAQDALYNDGGSQSIVKYESPIGQPARAYIPLAVCPAIADKTAPLWITEGEKKALLMCQEGLPTIALPGVSCGEDQAIKKQHADDGGYHSPVLRKDVAQYIAPNRDVTILFDSDVDRNLNVIKAAVKLAKMLRNEGANAQIAYLPIVQGATKTGADDWHVYCKEQSAGLSIANTIESRPVAPSELLDWLKDQKEEGVEKVDLKQHIKRALIWVGEWHRFDKKHLKDFIRNIKKIFTFIDEDFVENAQKILNLNVNYQSDPFKKVTDQWVAEECLPLINAHYMRFVDEAGITRRYKVNDKRECVLQAAPTNLLDDLNKKLCEKYGQVTAPTGLLNRALDKWDLQGTKMAEEPQPFTFCGDERLTFKHFNWSPQKGNYPAWEEFLNRLSAKEEFMAFVWSVFEPKNISRQYLWLVGDGQDGKSKVLEAISNVLDSAAASINNIGIKDSRWLLASLYGKRAVFYADCKNEKFGMTEIVRNITCGDKCPIENKGQAIFSARLYLKLFIASNEKPEFTGQQADTSRCIQIDVAPSKNKDDPDWLPRLQAEMPYFLDACREEYFKLCPKHGDIRLSDKTKTLVVNAARAFESNYTEIFSYYFKIEPNGSVSGRTLQHILQQERLSDNKIADFRKWLRRQGYGSKHTNRGTKYIGFCLRNPELFGKSSDFNESADDQLDDRSNEFAAEPLTWETQKTSKGWGKPKHD
jgi:hypothetical protein